MSEFKLTTVANIAGVDPEVWLADSNNLYVEDRWFFRKGRFAGKSWPYSIWRNACVRPKDHEIHGCPTRSDWENYIRRYAAHLVTQRLLMQMLPNLIGKTLGCWGYTWDGVSRPRPLSHACVLADWANGLAIGERRWENFDV